MQLTKTLLRIVNLPLSHTDQFHNSSDQQQPSESGAAGSDSSIVNNLDVKPNPCPEKKKLKTETCVKDGIYSI